jgi:hypothetical protein
MKPYTLLAALTVPLSALAVAVWAGCSTSSGGNGGGSDAGDGAVTTQNLCNNPADLDARARFYCPGNMGIDDIAAQCGVQCAYIPDAGPCTTACIMAVTEGGLSEGCASCFGVMVACAQKNCLTDCVMNPLGNACLSCRCGNNLPNHVNCYIPTEQCSGVHRTECDQLEAGTWPGYPTGDAGCAPEGGDDGGTEAATDAGVDSAADAGGDAGGDAAGD